MKRNEANVSGLSIFNILFLKEICSFVQENFLPGKNKYPYLLYRTKKKYSRLKCAKTLIDYKA
ncbi:hypothetical protein BpHYR1_039025 [Brachionus plicatilis]|uniref:Uncharacterized protein n=1 Tax=Brachionus plicatilis TaxID=10195 RepID=A0A3M7RMZ1_BRAPC|nr:hypothetical protein BpHYR1_039025 [Brachionus plicatilis]